MYAGLWTFPDLAEKSRVIIFCASAISALVLMSAVWVHAKKIGKDNLTNFNSDYQLLYLNVFLASALPVVFDILKNAHMSTNHRYVLTALPAAYVLFSVALSKCHRKALFLVVLIAVSTWMPLYMVYAKSESRREEDYRAIGRCLANADDSDAIIISYYYPINAIGVARYMPVEKKIIGWCSLNHSGDLSHDLLPLIKDKKGVYLVRVGPGYGGQMHPIRKWLQENTREKKTWLFSKIFREDCQYFVPRQGTVFQ